MRNQILSIIAILFTLYNTALAGGESYTITGNKGDISTKSLKELTKQLKSIEFQTEKAFIELNNRNTLYLKKEAENRYRFSDQGNEYVLMVKPESDIFEIGKNEKTLGVYSYETCFNCTDGSKCCCRPSDTGCQNSCRTEGCK